MSRLLWAYVGSKTHLECQISVGSVCKGLEQPFLNDLDGIRTDSSWSESSLFRDLGVVFIQQY